MFSGRYSVLQVGANTTVACSHVCLLGDNTSCDLSLDHHVSRICVGSYYRRIQQSVDSNLLATIVYTIVCTATLSLLVYQGQ